MKRIASTLFLLCLAGPALAGEISHYQPGVANIRDFLIPIESGMYVSSYSFYYQSGRLNDAAGDETNLPIYDVENGVFNDLYPDIDVYMMSIPIAFVNKGLFEHTKLENLRLDYGFVIAPLVANSSVGASLTAETEGGSDPVTSQFGFGDLYVQPLWLGYTNPTYTLSTAVSWGFYAPTGKYDTLPANHPVYGSIRIPSLENIGLGFWTNQFRGALQWSPRGPLDASLVLAGTYEVSSEKDDLHVTPGNQFTFNWGVTKLYSDLFGLKMPQNWLLELAIVGYDSWQVTSDSGPGRLNAYQDEVHAAGFQIGLAESACKNGVSFHYFNEYDAEDRFQGHVVGLSFTLHFGGFGPFKADPLPQPDCACSWRDVKPTVPTATEPAI